jgi:hypothetical protein
VNVTGKRLLGALVVTIALLGCNKSSAPESAPEENYTPATGAVGLDIISMGNADGDVRWLVTYTDGAAATKFQIALDRPTASNSGVMATGKGEFTSLPDSNPMALLEALRTSLHAKHIPNHIEKVESLPFEYALLGADQTRTADGAFHKLPKGNWTATKLFLANDQAEIYFNYNPVIHKAEFSIKDPEYGDRLLSQFAKIF